MATSVSDSRREEIVRAARQLLEIDVPSGLSMRRLADRLEIRAPSLYKHIPDKATLEAEIIAEGLHELGDSFAAAGNDISAQAAGDRRLALGHPHLYALMSAQPFPRDLLPEGLERAVAGPIVGASGDEHLARATSAAAHGLALLELAGRFPPTLLTSTPLGAPWCARSHAPAHDDRVSLVLEPAHRAAV
jgi:AcrR family transcriptional regulator